MSPSSTNSSMYVSDPLNPGQILFEIDPRFSGAQLYWNEKAAYAHEDDDVLAYWNSTVDKPAGNPHNRISRTFADWQANAVRDRDLNMGGKIQPPLDPGAPPQPPRRTLVTVTLASGGRFEYVVHVDPNGPLMAMLPDPLLPPLVTVANDPHATATVAQTNASGTISGVTPGTPGAPSSVGPTDSSSMPAGYAAIMQSMFAAMAAQQDQINRLIAIVSAPRM